MQLNVMCNYTNLQLHVSHATEFELQMTVAKLKISNSEFVDIIDWIEKGRKNT
jgi:hypothetical protein